MRSFGIALAAWCGLTSSAAAENVTVHGRAQPFALGDVLKGAKITCEEFPELTATTDDHGLFQLDAPVGANLTLTLTHEGSRTTTAATFTVPEGGIPQGAETEVPFQVPYKVTYDALILAMADLGRLKKEYCHFCVTVAGANKTLRDSPQGEPGTVATLYDGATGEPVTGAIQNYFGVMDGNKTDPFTRGLNATSWDGGVVWFNVPVATEPYIVRATKPGLKFTETRMTCHVADRFVNGAPTQGPHVIS